MRAPVTCAVLLAALLLSSCQLNGASGVPTVVSGAVDTLTVQAAAVSTSATVSARSATSSAGIPAFTHVFLIVLENAGFDQVTQGNAMPYLNQLGKTYSIATHYYAVTHPSLPNYLALLGGSTFGIQSDCTTCSVSGPNLVDQLEKDNKSWTAYIEGMPAACSPVPLWPIGRYAKKHNPFLYFSDIRDNTQRCRHIVPFSGFAADLAKGNVAAFTWITPDLCHDGHDCPLSQSDQWLATTVPMILNTTAFRQGGVLFITFDEAEGADAGGCCHLAHGGQVYTL
ncbi:MAG TPA: alkaline phosphatase family protein, partial [Chloroflexota bacterium]|nr:alkaline phosphatase family protein [Chloroflexota bacterium]